MQFIKVESACICLSLFCDRRLLLDVATLSIIPCLKAKEPWICFKNSSSDHSNMPLVLISWFDMCKQQIDGVCCKCCCILTVMVLIGKCFEECYKAMIVTDKTSFRWCCRPKQPDNFQHLLKIEPNFWYKKCVIMFTRFTGSHSFVVMFFSSERQLVCLIFFLCHSV